MSRRALAAALACAIVSTLAGCSEDGATPIDAIDAAADSGGPGDPSQALQAVLIAAGGDHTCVIDPGDAVLCWGEGGDGQLGHAAGGGPAAVAGLGGVVALGLGDKHSCAALDDGSARCWGFNGNGQLGDGSNTSSAAPVAVVGLTDAVAVAAGESHTCARRGDGSVWCWGRNHVGQLGRGHTSVEEKAAAPVADLADAVALVIGRRHSCARRDAGQVMCWGLGAEGVMGDGTTDTSEIPNAVLGLAFPDALAAGWQHNCATRTNRAEIACWGKNAAGQLGNGRSIEDYPPDAAFEALPTAVSNASGEPLEYMTLLAAGREHSCAVSQAGVTLCWGQNAQGQLGADRDPDATPLQRVPVAVVGLEGVTAVVAGFDHTCALAAEGRVLCWGANQAGQLGGGATGPRAIRPVFVPRP